jgi:hypothetical protein
MHCLVMLQATSTAYSVPSDRPGSSKQSRCDGAATRPSLIVSEKTVNMEVQLFEARCNMTLFHVWRHNHSSSVGSLACTVKSSGARGDRYVFGMILRLSRHWLSGHPSMSYNWKYMA